MPDEYQVFKIKTNKKEYTCNIFSVYTSNVIRQILEKDPNAKEFSYDFEDKNCDFQVICDFFNFKQINIKNVDIDIIKSIAEDLQIHCIIHAIDNYIDKCQKFSKKIEKHKETIETIDGLFELLYNIKSYGVEKVKASIVSSRWSKKEEDVKELAAFILQVVKPSFSLHKEISELIIELSKEADDGNELKILVPFIVDRLMTLYWPRSIERKESELQDQIQLYNRCDTSKAEETINLTNRCVYSFIRILYKHGIISKEEIYFRLKKYDLSNNVLNAFFLPELIDVDPKNINKIEALYRRNNRLLLDRMSPNRYLGAPMSKVSPIVFPSFGPNYYFMKLAKKYLPDRIDMYERMLENMEPDDELTKSLRHDNVDKFQDIVNRDGLDINKGRVPYNIIDDFEEDISYLNYSAFCGSVKCFKFIILNKGEVDDTTFYFSVCGGNNEIIKIVNQKEPKVDIYKNRCRQIEKNDIHYLNNNGYLAPFWFKSYLMQKTNHIPDCLISYINDKYNDDNIQYEKYEDNGDLLFLMNYCNINNIIASSIAMNKNDIFDSTFEKIFINNNKYGDELKYIANLSAKSGNAHSLMKLFENGFHVSKKIISNCAKNGFYSLTKLLLDLYDEETEHTSNITVSYNPFNYKSTVHFGNRFIFKLFIDRMNQFDLAKAILDAIKKNNMDIASYAFENLDKFDFIQYNDDDFIQSALKSSMETGTSQMFDFLKDQSIKLNPEVLNLELFSDLLIHSCLFSNFAVAKEITDMIQKEDPKYDFTEAFFKASSSKSMDICRLFIDRKVNIDFEKKHTYQNLVNIDFES